MDVKIQHAESDCLMFQFETQKSTLALNVYLNVKGVFTPDSLLVDWKLTFLWFFLYNSFVLKFAGSSNERDFFSRFTRSKSMSNQIIRIRVTPKKSL